MRQSFVFPVSIALLLASSCEEPAPDAGAPDAGVVDAGALDAGALDAGVVDAGALDAGVVDAGALDAGVVDAGALDAGVVDAGALDAGVVDAGVVDAGAPVADAGPVDAGVTNPFDVPYTVETLPGTFGFLEGPVWRPLTSDLLFSDIPARTILRFTDATGATPFVTDIDCNGLVLDGDDVVVAGAAGRDLKRVQSDGGVQETPLTFEGEQLNSPNDLVFHSDGTLYFTDPGFGVNQANRGVAFNGVYRLVGDTLTAEDEFTTTERPNGIALSPDEATLYVSDSSAPRLWSYAVQSDGSLGNRIDFASVSTSGDGLAVDVVGNVYVTTSAGVEVIAPSGENLGAIVVPEQPANCTFGDDDLRTLYITARTGLYRVRLAIPGQPPAR